MKPITYRFSISQLIWRKTQSLAFSHLIETKITHAHDFKLGNSAVQSSKAILYHSESTAFLDARKLFEEVSDLSVVSATAIIGRFVRQHRYEEAIYMSPFIGRIPIGATVREGQGFTEAQTRQLWQFAWTNSRQICDRHNWASNYESPIM